MPELAGLTCAIVGRPCTGLSVSTDGLPQAVDNSAVHLPPRARTPEVDPARSAPAMPADLSTGQAGTTNGQPAAPTNRLPLRPVGRNALASQPCASMSPATAHQPAPPPETWTPSAPGTPASSPSVLSQQAPAGPAPALSRRPQRQIPHGWHRSQSQSSMNPGPGTSRHPANTRPRPVTPPRAGRPHCLRPSAHRRCHHLMRCRTR
jgi:hypothetical protein